jgi:D-alanyl-D-alanine carboxypeptidase (penicillin-binding protein 5/6)
MAALRIPALGNVLAVRQVRLPVAGTVHNLNALLGSHGVIGGKTGTTSQAGGCFVFAARRRVGRVHVTVIGAVLGQLSDPATERTLLNAVFHTTAVTLDSLPGSLELFAAVAGHRSFAHLRAPWTRPVPVRLGRVPALVGWPGLEAKIRILAYHHLPAPIHAGQRVGTAIVSAGGQRARVGLVAAGEVPAPTLGWRLSHP